jgi:hypothetical protein
MASGDAAVELSVAAERTGLLASATGRAVHVQLAATELFGEGLLPTEEPVDEEPEADEPTADKAG